MLLDFWPALVALTLLTMTPGADTLIIMKNTSRGGLMDGSITSLGICSGLFIHALVSAAGISVILLQSATAFSVLKLAGAAYLVWLGVGSLKQAFRSNTAMFDVQSKEHFFSAVKSFQEGFLSNVLNPKTVIFYMAFLPQFINPEGSALVQSMTLAALHFTIAMIWQISLVLMVNKARVWLSRPIVNRGFNGVTGSLLVSLGIGLALQKSD
ncbi:threonine transporter RhtB [Endozoicomonas sp. OPT23]|uniref:LysE family translocator n=1 Tax=Endozoicomonas sp. OPT23 TaxID=2072845 RepID=UPI00129A0C90|nr:LysE family translocator [Endozoicomonas sp. OPT23]MRI33228.1 threonine transporter RhtB [Endozoicomonas sp. OPT23]